MRAVGRWWSATLLVALAAGAVPTESAAAQRGWEPRPRLVDVDHSHALDVSEAVAQGDAVVPLPYTLTIEGGRYDALRVGTGTLEFQSSQPLVSVDLAGMPQPGDPRPPGPRLDVLAGDDVRVAPGTPVLVSIHPDGVVVRWADLRVGTGGASTVEVAVDRLGALTVQYLRLAADVPQAHVAGRVRTGLAAGLPTAPGAGPLPRPAAAFGLRPELLSLVPIGKLPVSELPVDPPEVDATGPPPPGCVADPGTWCDIADGPAGNAIFFLDENFDDGLSGTRGWGPSPFARPLDLWHEVDFATCTPGASANPGRAWYHGRNATCTYDDLDNGTLSSPAMAPITAGTFMTFSFRLSREVGPDPNAPFDDALILIDNVVTFRLNNPPLANAWYNINPIDMTPFVGATRIQFQFTSDVNITQLGWFIDDVRVWNTNGANANCRVNAGVGGKTPCSTRVTDRWDFNEGAFCQGCTYSFYALVECGREMHLPLDDMEGADVRVTNVLTGQPVPLRCVNETARADAGLGAYPGFNVPDVNGVPLDCCPPAGPEVFWGPPLDVVDNAGPGRVAWGFPFCDSFLVYDFDVDGGVECSELPSCGGQLDFLSPGELQTMDCFISDDAGLCGLYRVEIISGGFDWRLFANCDGTDTPQFQLFHDCTEAWAAFNPLPELAVANLTTGGGCPDLVVDFDLVNIGCEDHPGPTLVRLQSDCMPQTGTDVLDIIVPDPVPRGGSVHVQQLFNPSCQPVRVEVFADPDNTVAECTESITVAACRAEEGIDSLATFACGCTANLVSNPGPDRAGCPGSVITLDGSLSTVTPCMDPLYRWIDDATGMELAPASTSPRIDVVVGACPAVATYTLEVSCSGEICVDTDQVTVRCIAATADAGPATRACVGDPVTLTAAASVVTNCAQPQYRWLDPAGAPASAWGPGATFPLGALTCAAAGTWTVEVRCASDTTCVASATVDVACVEVIANAGPALTTCENSPLDVTGASSTSTGCTTVAYQWFDLAGAPVTGVLADPAITIPGLTGCPGTLTIVLVAACQDLGFETCGSFDFLDIDCAKPMVPLPAAVAPVCLGSASDLQCGVVPPEPGVTYTWDVDVLTDSDMDGDPANDVDESGCDVPHVHGAVGSFTARVTAEDANGCRESVDVPFDVAGSIPLPDVADLRLARSGAQLDLSWSAATDATSYRVLRGNLVDSLWLLRLYDHAADDAAGRGTCDAGPSTGWRDPDDGNDGGRPYYYLVTALGPCASEGGTGSDSLLALRPPRLPTAACP